VKQSTLMETLKQDTTLEGIGRLENVTALLDAINEFVENDEIIDEIIVPDKTLSTYLQNIALVTDADKGDADPDTITLMSVHSAKGLEFKSVIVSGLEDDLFPSFMSKDSPEGLDEERRLFYVAITRAEKYLTLAYATSRYRNGQMKYGTASRFLEEINPEHLDGMGGLLSNIQGKGAVERSKVTGVFSKTAIKAPENRIDPKDFNASPTEKIQKGQRILHLRFGEGTVLNLEGAKDNPIAEIEFDETKDKKKIALKFAKLQILA
jgi:DNA helicase II / ATP-dependent DNA helicase PcrA